MGAKPLALSLSKVTKVIYVDPPFSLLTSLKQKKFRHLLFSKKYRKVNENLYRFTPLVLPGKDRPGIYKITSAILKRKIQKLIKKSNIKNKPILITTAPHYHLFSNDTSNIYWVMDDYISQPELTGINRDVLVEGHKFQCENSDLILCASEKIHTGLNKYHSKSSIFLNGADTSLFKYPADKYQIKDLPEKEFAVYVGGINDRIDLNYLEAVANAQIPLVIAGNCSINDPLFTEICSKSNVFNIGPIEYEKVPYLMNLAKVGLVPYKNNEFNNASMPLKISEYLSCGIEVVSTNLEYTKVFDAQDVHSANSTDEFVSIVQECLSKDLYPSIRVMRSSRIASIWSWDKKAQDLIDLI
ncbi:MAG: glycosyltransferase [Acidimicrobiia bacterium]